MRILFLVLFAAAGFTTTAQNSKLSTAAGYIFKDVKSKMSIAEKNALCRLFVRMYSKDYNDSIITLK